MVKTFAFAVALCALATNAFAQAESCHARAADKKLAGAALTSFLKKCERDAKTTCETTAADKKLAGAAKTSFTKKCVRDSIGT